MNFNDIARIVRPIAQKIDRVITRGVVTKVNNDGVDEFNPGSGDSPQLVSVEGMPGDIYTEIPRYQQYGFESYPPPGAEAVLLAPSGESENSFIIVIQDISQRPTDLEEKNSTQWDEQGGRVKLAGGKVAIGNVNTPMVSTPTAAKVEFLEIVDRLLTVLQGVTNLGGVASGPSFLASVLAELALLQTDLQNIKGTL